MTTSSPDEVFAALHAETGGRLFTVTVLNRDAGLAQRVYSSHPVDYPVSGTKPMGQGEWTNIVIERGEVFVANTVPEFASYFADHALIESLGCQSALNIPVGKDLVVGTVNILDVAHHFDAGTVDRCITAVDTQRDRLLNALASVSPK